MKEKTEIEAARLADPNHIAKFHDVYQDDKKTEKSHKNHKATLLRRAGRFPFVTAPPTADRHVDEESLWKEYLALPPLLPHWMTDKPFSAGGQSALGTERSQPGASLQCVSSLYSHHLQLLSGTSLFSEK